jgi:hypothetical protein
MAWNGSQWAPFSGGLSNSASLAVTVHALGAGFEAGRPVLYAGGNFSRVGNQPAANLARWTSPGWEPVPGGLTRQGQTNFAAVQTLAFFPPGEAQQLFVGGNFTEAGGRPALAVARWTGSEWQPAGSGFQTPGQIRGGSLTTLHVTDGPSPELFAAGLFDLVNDNPTRLFNGPSLARWNGSTWDAPADSLGRNQGVNGLVSAVYGFNDGRGFRLFVGGQFSDVYVDRFLSRLEFVARRDAAGWEPAGHVLDGPVGVLAHAVVGTNAPSLFVGGPFRLGGGAALRGIYRQTPNGYDPLGAGLSYGTPGAVAEATTLLPSDLEGTPSLYVGGIFEFAGTNRANAVARWDGQNWHALAGGLRAGGNPGAVTSLRTAPASAGRGIAVGGFFDTAGTLRTRNVALWTGTEWRALGDGLSGSVLTLATFPQSGVDQLIAGGNFIAVDAQSRTGRGVASWNGSRWLALRGTRSESPNGQVFSLAVHDDGSGTALFAGGDFANAPDGSSQNGVARWDGNNWTYLTAVSDGARFAQVNHLLSFEDETGSTLYAVVRPFFTEENGGEPRLARWDGTAWEVFADSRIENLGALTPAPNTRPPTLILGGGENNFHGRIWTWSHPPTPCPAPMPAFTP